MSGPFEVDWWLSSPEFPGLLIWLDEEGRIQESNGRLEEFLGQKEPDCANRFFADCVDPDSRQAVKDWLRSGKTEAARPSKALEFCLGQRNGSLEWARARLACPPVEEPRNRPGACLLFVEKISFHRELEERQRQSRAYRDLNEKKLSMLLELNRQAPTLTEKELCDQALDIAVFVTRSKVGYLHLVNPDQNSIRLVSWNKEALRLCTAEYDSHYPLHKAGIWADSARFKKPAIHNDYPNAPNRRGVPEGHFPIIRHMSAPVMNGDKVNLIVGVGNKETDYNTEDVRQLQHVAEEIDKYIMRKRAEDTLRQLNKNLRAVVRRQVKRGRRREQLLIQQSRMAAMGEMLGVIAHQWKQPLNTISLLFQILEEILNQGRVDPKAVKDTRRQLDEQIQYLTDTIHDFRDFYQPDKEIQTFYSCELVKEAARLTRARFQKNQIQVDIPEHCHFETRGYPNELKQVFLVLLQNAGDAFEMKMKMKMKARATAPGKGGTSREAGYIRFAFEQMDGMGLIRVEDNAGGIRKDLLPDKLFEPRVTTKTHDHQASGIGLHIARLIIEEKFHGTISAANHGDGARFIIRLPVAK